MAGAGLLVGGLGPDTVWCRVEVVLGLPSACWWVGPRPSLGANADSLGGRSRPRVLGVPELMFCPVVGGVVPIGSWVYPLMGELGSVSRAHWWTQPGCDLW